MSNSGNPIEVNEALVRKVADLARLALTDAEVTLFSTQMKVTLGYVEQISKATIPEGTEPMYHPFDMATPMRDDTVVTPMTTADGKPKMIRSAPDTLYEGFKVPPIL